MHRGMFKKLPFIQTKQSPHHLFCGLRLNIESAHPVGLSGDLLRRENEKEREIERVSWVGEYLISSVFANRFSQKLWAEFASLLMGCLSFTSPDC